MKKEVVAILIVIFSMTALQGCTSTAPVSNSTTARSLGKGKVMASTGTVSGSGFGTWVGYGATKNTDIYLVYEESLYTDNFGAAIKHSFKNNPEEFSYSVDLGYGISGYDDLEKDDPDTGYYSYIGTTLSYKMKWFEPYFVARFNHVKAHRNQLGRDWFKFWGADLAGQEPLVRKDYVQFSAGANFWFNKHFGVTLGLDTPMHEEAIPTSTIKFVYRS
jgi:hypothetical protein